MKKAFIDHRSALDLISSKSLFVFLSLLCMLIVTGHAHGQQADASSVLKVPLEVKETAGVGAEAYPVTTVVPLPFGKYYETDKFRLVDMSGNTVPAQFDVLNRWWDKDNSIRHLLINFQSTVKAKNIVSSGISTYYLQDDGSGTSIGTGLNVTESATSITVNTGPLRFTVNKSSFNILDEVWLDQDGNRIFEDRKLEGCSKDR